jgi:uncharacterized phage protein gp47/JayE
MAGLTSNGLVIRLQPELQALLEAQMIAAFPGLNVRSGPIQQLIGILSEAHAIAWETLQAVYSNGYPDGAEGVFLDQLAALTGTQRRAATKSSVVATLNLDDGVTVPAGSLAAVDGNPQAQFTLLADVTNSTGITDDFDGNFECVETGAIAAPAGTLTQIVTPVTGWNSVTNANDAELGRDRAEDPELRLTRQIELAGSGQDSYAAIRAAVSKVVGVLSVQVVGNETLTTDIDGRPGKSVEAIIWDGASVADDDAVSQAIWDEKAAGISAYGATDSGTAVDETGADQTVDFTRGTELLIYVSPTVILKPGTGMDWATQIQAAVNARGLEYTVGSDAYASQLTATIQELPFIEAVTDLRLGTAPSPTGFSVPTTYRQIIRIPTTNVVSVEA